MTATLALRHTPLHLVHKRMGARLADFHGWELPIQFSSILKEHQAVRSRCGVFDVSHMGQVLVEGPQAAEFLQRVGSNDVRLAGPGKAIYSHLLNPLGGVVDDVVIACLGEGRYLLVLNAAMMEKDTAWLEKNAAGFEASLRPRGGAILAVQGPLSAKLVADLIPRAAGLARFGAAEAELFSQPVVVQRSGYTGEDGFEILLPDELASRLWEELMTKGRSFGIEPCGLGSRDTLRLEAGYLLYGQDVDEEHTPLEAGCDWVVKFEKGEFIGREALLRQKREGLRRRWTGVRLLERGVPRPGSAVYVEDEPAGRLTSATFSPTLQTGIGVGYLSPPGLPPGRKVSVEIHGRRAAAEVCALPFYRRPAS